MGLSPIPVAIAAVLAGAGAYAVARLWPARSPRLVVFGVALFAFLVAAMQIVGILAAITKTPLVGPWTVALAVAVLSALAWGWSSRVARAGSLPKETGDGSHRRLDPTVLVAIGVAVVLLPNAIVLALSAPPRGWDVLAYHLPRAVAWLQHGNLGNYGASAAFFPGNGEIALLFGLFSGTDRLVPLVQLPFALLGAVAVYGLARELGTKARSAAVSAVVFLAAPIVFFQSAIAKNDLMVAALVAAGALLLCRALRSRNAAPGVRTELAVAGLAFGLALGTKYTVVPTALLVLPLVFFLFRQRERDAADREAGRRAWRGPLRHAATFGIAMAVPSLFWFLQNWIVAGNPFAPLAVGVGGWEIWSGTGVAGTYGAQELRYVASPSGWILFPWIDHAKQGSYSSSVGFGAAFAALAGPGFVLGIARLRAMDEERRLRPCLVAVLSLLAIVVGTWCISGFRLPRYLLPAFALACVPVALLFDSAGRATRSVLVGVLVVGVAFSSLESLRVVYGDDDLVASKKDFPTRSEHYHMPDMVYEFPEGTRLLVLQVNEGSFHQTYRYPLVGNLPGNTVVAMGDHELGFGILSEGAVAAHRDLLADDIEYIFMRTIAFEPQLTIFDPHPELYTRVLDLVERPYEWYKKGYLEDSKVRAPTVTVIFQVLRPESR